ncbi:MAG: hypothetical protein A2W22_06630 [Candidatus Levybacteria bacterium RBG_16_35_11]|nr:MAG: hypothetical protein A2W22_06630 [Candidatus Levybacteria bacterium RBG_16_35_11]
MVSNKQAVLKTLQYSDLFNFPQTGSEIRKFLIKKIEAKRLKVILTSSKEISYKSGFYFLKGKEKIVSLRKKREIESSLKIKKAKKFIKLLSIIPSVLLIGISGSVSVKNAKRNDDIDLFIITQRNTLWATRFLMIIFLKLCGVYRKRDEENVKDKFCLNMFLAEDALGLSPERQNMYIAREISQLMPIFQRDKIYEKFILKNNWIGKFMPNSISCLKKEHARLVDEKKKIIGSKIISMLEKPLHLLQIKIIKRHQTKEVVASNFVAFHPNDLSLLINKRYLMN